MKRAYVTMLCGGDGYVPGVEALGRSLRATGTEIPMLAMCTTDISKEARANLVSQGWLLRDIEPIAKPAPKSEDDKPLYPRFENVYAKLRVWELPDLEKAVFLDADTLVLKNIDDLFDRPAFCAAPDFLLPDRFNSGVMVLEPSAKVFAEMEKRLGQTESYDGGDQGFLNEFFDWYGMSPEHRLPAGYNMHHFIFEFCRAHPVLRKTVEREARILHYSVQKPWGKAPLLSGGASAWWNLYYGAHPEEDRAWKRKLHALQDWTFDHVIDAFLA